MREEIKRRLLELSEEQYRNFSSALLPNIDNVLGVRLPKLRKLAKEIYSSGRWPEYLLDFEPEYMEETMLQGMLIGLIKVEPEELLRYTRDFVPKINNWAVCDTFCNSLKFTKNNQELVWNFLKPYLASKKEYDIRFAAVMLLNFFVDDKYILKVLEELDKLQTDDYYAQMAIAWAVSICFIKFPDKTYEYLWHSHLSNWIFNKAIQKCIESYRISTEVKEKLQLLKRDTRF